MLPRRQRQLDPQRLYYSSQRLLLRTSRLVEALERATGARPGAGVQVSVSGTTGLEEAVERAGRRIAFVAGGGVLVVAAAAWLADRDRDRGFRRASGVAARARRGTRRRS